VSAFIGADGQIIQRAPKGEIAVIERTIQGRQGSTPFIQQGNLIVVVLSLLGCLIAARINHKRSAQITQD